MRSTLLWFLWLITPVFALAFHYGPGQAWLARDRAAAMIRAAERHAETALQAQAEAYQTQLDVLSARRAAFQAGVDWQSQTQHPLSKSVEKATKRQEEAYESAADLWDQSTELYRDAADELLKVEETSSDKSRPELSVDDLNVIESLRWAEARAMVRAGEVFNGVNQLEALMTYRLARQSDSEYTERTKRPSSLPMDAIREELAAAQYVGARLLREEGRPPEIWRPVANSARQHYRYLASATSDESSTEANVETRVGSKATNDETKIGRHNRFQRNLEQVLNLEQSVTDQLEGIPLPRRSPLARRPGDGEPGDGPPGRRPGRGPLQDGPPNNGAGVPGPMGRGW